MTTKLSLALALVTTATFGLLGCAGEASDPQGDEATAQEIVSPKVGRFSAWYDVYSAGQGTYRLRVNVRGMAAGDAVSRAGVLTYFNPCVLHYGATMSPCADPFQAKVQTAATQSDKKALVAPWRAGTTGPQAVRWVSDSQLEIILDPANTSGLAPNDWIAIAKPLTVVIPIRTASGSTTTLGVTAVLRAEADIALGLASAPSIKYPEVTTFASSLHTTLSNYNGPKQPHEILVNTSSTLEALPDGSDWSLILAGQSYMGGGCDSGTECRGYAVSPGYEPLEKATDISVPVRALFSRAPGAGRLRATLPDGTRLEGAIQAKFAASAIAIWASTN